MMLPFAEARSLADDARARGLELGEALSIALVDYGGFVVLVERMDGARPRTPSIAPSKAYSAAVMQRPTYLLEGWRNSDPVFFTQVGRMGQHPIVTTKGGFTLKRDGVIMGGLGISGGSRTRTRRSARTRCGQPGSNELRRAEREAAAGRDGRPLLLGQRDLTGG